ncbi:hypothetical protein [Streptomyces erythrochromogenes]|uniref:hypothetical protein n=1 Tax=Streptomyces erythrochromogenes TaxID=285574 RepID=UPI000303F257
MTGARVLSPRGVRARAAATWQVRSYLAARRPGGGFLLAVPSAIEDNIAHLAGRTGLAADTVRSAVRILEERGDLALVAGRGLMILRGQIAHPDDEGMVARIREGLDRGDYVPGQPLALAVIALEYGGPSARPRRACRPLIREGLLQSLPRGPLGPGIYVRRAEVPHPVQNEKAVQHG